MLITECWKPSHRHLFSIISATRALCLFTLGINTNLRASDLLRITAGMVRHLEAGDELTLKEQKTGNHGII